MSKLTSLRAAIVTRIGQAAPALKKVTPHVGRYTVDDLKRLLQVTPSCAVGIANVTKPVPRASGEVTFDVAFAAVVCARGTTIDAADDDAIDLGVQVAIALSTWVPAAVVSRVLPAKDIQLEAVGDDEIDKSGMVIWAVIWRHEVTIGVDAIASSLSAQTLPANPQISVTHPTQGDVVAGGAE